MATSKNQQRVNFSRMQKHMPYPDFLEIQLKSFQDFLQMDSTPEQRRKEGLFKVFSENFPIQDTRCACLARIPIMRISTPSFPTCTSVLSRT